MRPVIASQLCHRKTKEVPAGADVMNDVSGWRSEAAPGPVQNRL